MTRHGLAPPSAAAPALRPLIPLARRACTRVPSIKIGRCSVQIDHLIVTQAAALAPTQSAQRAATTMSKLKPNPKSP